MHIMIVAGHWNTRTFYWLIARYIMVWVGVKVGAFSFIGHTGDVSKRVPCIAVLKDMITMPVLQEEKIV